MKSGTHLKELENKIKYVKSCNWHLSSLQSHNQLLSQRNKFHERWKQQKKVLLKALENLWVWSLPRLPRYIQSVQKLQQSNLCLSIFEIRTLHLHDSCSLEEKYLQVLHDGINGSIRDSHTPATLEEISHYAIVLDVRV